MGEQKESGRGPTWLYGLAGGFIGLVLGVLAVVGIMILKATMTFFYPEWVTNALQWAVLLCMLWIRIRKPLRAWMQK
jgi:hypothetical protein